MFSSAAMTPADRRRMALEMARMRAARYTSRRHPTRRLPDALPCHDNDKAFANVPVPMGNVAMSNGQELQSWLLVARPVSRKEAEKSGGCIKFTPLHVDAKSGFLSSSSTKPQYFCITDTDDEVYGRAAYLPRTGMGVTKSLSMLSHDATGCSSSSAYECTEEDEDVEDVSEKCCRHVTPHRNNSCRCVPSK